MAMFGYQLRKIDMFPSPLSISVLISLFGKDEKIIIFDVGAHRGESAKKYKDFFKNAEIFSFEPFDESFDVLKRLNIAKFKPFNIGLSDKKALEKFSINIGSETNSLLQLTEKAKDVWGSNYRLNQIDIINVNFNTLDEFCKENSVNFIDFLKLDVQGAEFKVLKGAHKSLMGKKIKVIQLEVIISKTYVGQKSLAYYIELLEGYGYKLINFSDFTFVNGELVQTDLFFKSGK